MENPDYVAVWRAHAGPTVREAPLHVFRRQTEADLKAARWNLLAWEDLRHPQWAGIFRACPDGRGTGRGAAQCPHRMSAAMLWAIRSAVSWSESCARWA